MAVGWRVPEIDAEPAERVLSECDPAPRSRRPLLERWTALLNDVSAANVVGGGWPRHKIGRFDAVICCGRGTYGLVFEVVEPDLQRRCALKMCDSERQDSADVLAEARLLASLSHPNIITVYEIGSYVHRRYIPEEGRYDVEHPHDLKDPFFVMEYATGKTARHFALDCEEYGDAPPTWQEVLDIFLGAGKGLTFAHEKGIVHGDFKPSNVLIDEGGARPRVADFGFARTQLRHTPEHERDAVRVQAGTHVYAAPEALRGTECDALSDQWSFCASLWHCLEGRLPFGVGSTDQLLETINGTEPRRGKRAVPETLRTVLECGLSIDPADRFPSMDELLQALELVRRTAVTPHASREEQAEVKLRSPQRRRRKGPGWGPFAIIALVAGASLAAAVAQQSHAAVRPGLGVALVVPDPRPPATGCALTRAEKDHVVTREVDDICKTIRVGNIVGADALWLADYLATKGPSAIDALVVARTFVGQAETFLSDGRYDDATDARQKAQFWVTQAASKLGDEHAGVRWVLFRQNLVRISIHSQHSTTPLPSMLP